MEKVDADEDKQDQNIKNEPKQIDTLFSVNRLELCVGAQVMRYTYYMDHHIFEEPLKSIDINPVAMWALS